MHMMLTIVMEGFEKTCGTSYKDIWHAQYHVEQKAFFTSAPMAGALIVAHAIRVAATAGI